MAALGAVRMVKGEAFVPPLALILLITREYDVFPESPVKVTGLALAVAGVAADPLMVKL